MNSQAKPSSISQSSLNKNTPSACTQTPRLFSRLPEGRVGPREVPRESGGPSYERDGGRAHRKRLCQAGDGGKGTSQNTAKKGLGRQTPNLGSEHSAHTAGAAPPPDPRSSPQPGPSAPRHRGVTPSVPTLGNKSQRSLRGGHPPGRAPPRTGPTKSNSSSHWSRRTRKGEPAPDPIAADSAGSTQHWVASASACSIISQPCRGPRAGRDARSRDEHALGTDATRLLSELAPDIALPTLT